MPTYAFECTNQKCLAHKEVFESIKKCTALFKQVRCDKCKSPMRNLIFAPRYAFVRNAPKDHINIPGDHAEDWKINRHIKEVQALQREGLTEAEEVAAYEAGREREKERGFDKGHVSGGRAPLVKRGEDQNSPEIKKRISKWKDKAKSKIASSQATRRKVVK